MSNATVEDVLYLFKNYKFVIWFDNGYGATKLMNWDDCWKCCEDLNILKAIPKRCGINIIEDNCINIKL